ncbi:MAG: hypothetical protein IT374_11485 [Polyangiaceae bacterium]|nr:hypothetical protein [Polyangiaceae bacterium]
MRRALLSLLSVLWAAPLVSACGSAFEPPSRIESLRVLGVQVDPPYGKPGESSKLEILYFDGSKRAYLPDGSPDPAHRVQVLWLAGCHNPPGDLYFRCFPVLAERFAGLGAPGSGPPPAELLDFLGEGPRFTLKIPADIISSKPEPLDGNIPYGLSYTFFAVCGGKLGPPNDVTKGLPIGCYDEATGAALGADDFVFGFTPTYTYAEVTNKNPVITGMSFEKQPSMSAACKADADCKSTERCGRVGWCIPVVPHCTTRDVADCPTYEIKPTMAPADNVEIDVVSPELDGRVPEEIIWLNYYTSDGTIVRDLALVNDAQRGWNEKHETKWSAPNAFAGESRVWVVAHDNRGGTAWSFQDVFVE